MVKKMSAELESIEHELDESIASLRKAGIRITPQRQAILKFMISSKHILVPTKFIKHFHQIFLI